MWIFQGFWFNSVLVHFEFNYYLNFVHNILDKATKQLVAKLQNEFPQCGVLDALGIFYSQYWLAPNVEYLFCTHLDIVKNHYCEMKHVGTTKNVNPIWNLLDKWELNA